jgi:two-component system chemotaxis sensor kinase CheA
MDDSEVYDLLFHPGFSTTEEVSDVSGRGVGMDVVQEVVKQVDGSIDVQSDPDEGTSVTMTLPVSVAIVRVLFVESDGEIYGIPIKNIDEISEVDDVHAQNIENRAVITHDDRIYPVVHLGDALGVPDADKTADDMIIRVKDTVRQVAIRCESVTGQEEVVIKPFEGILSGTPGISGASVLGEGDVVIILDVETL